jgi:hypothetical protein
MTDYSSKKEKTSSNTHYTISNTPLTGANRHFQFENREVISVPLKIIKREIERK